MDMCILQGSGVLTIFRKIMTHRTLAFSLKFAYFQNYFDLFDLFCRISCFFLIRNKVSLEADLFTEEEEKSNRKD